MTVREKQSKFTLMVARLICHAYALGYELTFDDAYSKPEFKRHMKNSLHYIRLAIDLNLFKNGRWLNKTTDYKPLGEYWESIGGTWGGRFSDGCHFSLAHEGRK